MKPSFMTRIKAIMEGVKRIVEKWAQTLVGKVADRRNSVYLVNRSFFQMSAVSL